LALSVNVATQVPLHRVSSERHTPPLGPLLDAPPPELLPAPLVELEEPVTDLDVVPLVEPPLFAPSRGPASVDVGGELLLEQ